MIFKIGLFRHYLEIKFESILFVSVHFSVTIYSPVREDSRANPAREQYHSSVRNYNARVPVSLYSKVACLRIAGEARREWGWSGFRSYTGK